MFRCPITTAFLEGLTSNFATDPNAVLYDECKEHLHAFHAAPMWGGDEEILRTRAFVSVLLTAGIVANQKAALDLLFAPIEWADLHTEEICQALQARSDDHVVTLTAYELREGSSSVISGKKGRPLGLEAAKRLYPLYDVAIEVFRQGAVVRNTPEDVACASIGRHLAEAMRLGSTPWGTRTGIAKFLLLITTENYLYWRTKNYVQFVRSANREVHGRLGG